MPTESPVAQAKRLTCEVCLRPQSSCICQWITPTEHIVEVLILQHPQEVHQAKGSARLLHLSLPHSRMVTGEVFAVDALRSSKHSILLYPDSPEDKTLGILKPPTLNQAWLENPAQLRLIVLDGTWRKSRKMLYRNPLLQQLPRLQLRGMSASQYLIRKAHRPDQLSTLEATCAAMAELEGNAEKFSPLLSAFDGFVAQQLGYRLT